MNNQFNPSHFQLPPPKTPEHFEDICLDLFQAIWDDPYAKKNGRKGQKQHGVDIYSSDMPGKGIVGVQCKNKDLQLNNKLTPNVIDEEVAKTETFELSLSGFIIATTGPRDANLQKHVRLISERRIKEGKFPVDIMFWDDLVGQLNNHPKIIAKHWGDGWIQSKTQSALPDSIRQTDKNAMISGARVNQQTIYGEGNVQIINTGANASITVSMPQPDVDINLEYQEEVNHSLDLLNKHSYSEAIEYLAKLKERIWAKANNRIKFRILTNIACAQSGLKMYSKAAANYLEAYKFQPKDIKAESNRAFANLLLEEYETAIKQADDVLKKDSKNIKAASIKIQAMVWLKKPYEEIIKTVKDLPTDSYEVQCSLAFAAQELKKNSEALNYLRAARAKNKHNPHIMVNLAAHILIMVKESNKFVIPGMLDQNQRQQVEESIKLLEEAWGLISDKKDKEHCAEWLHNLFVAYRLIGDEDKAKDVSERLIQLKPDNELYIKNAAIIALESGEYKEAENHLNNLIELNSEMPELSLMLAASLRGQDRNSESIESIEKFLDSYSEKDNLWAEAMQDLFVAYSDDDQHEKAKDIADMAAKTRGHEAVGLMLYAKLELNKQDSYKARSYVEKASKEFTGKESQFIKIDFAGTAYGAGSFEIAAQLYEETINPCVDNSFTRKYLHSLYEIKQYQKIIEISKKIRKEIGVIAEITRYEWVAHQELGDLKKAQKVLAEYIEKYPKDEEAKLRLAIISLRMKETKKVEAYLQSDIKLSKLDSFSLIQLSSLYEINNMSFRAIEIMYFARRRFINDPDVHLNYMMLFLRYDDTKTKKLDVDTVQTDTVMLYDDSYFLIEDDNPDKSKFEISTDEAKKRGFIGKKIGEEITIVPAKKIKEPQKAKIKGIKSKYVHSLHDSTQNYERKFPDCSNFMNFNPEQDNFSSLLKQLDYDKKGWDDIRRLYGQNNITIDVFAKLIGKDFLEVIYGIQKIPDLGIRMAKGTENETAKGRENILNNNEIVIDITAIITLHSLGINPKEIGLKKFLVGQKTCDLLTQNIHQEKISKKPAMTIYKDDKGNLVRQEITATDHKKRLEDLRNLEKWVKDNTIIRPIAQPQIDILRKSSKNPNQLEEILEKSQLEAITLALGEGRILLCDDVGLRDLADSLGVLGAWTQMLLQVQLEKEELTKEEYNNFIIQLVNRNYRYIGVSSGVLMAAAEQSKWLPQYPFEGTIKALSRPETTIESITVVATNFFFELYTQPILNINTSSLIYCVLSAVAKHHDRNIFLPNLKNAVRIRFKLISNHSDDLLSIISTWENI